MRHKYEFCLNDGGRKFSSIRPNAINDCVIRAIAIASKQPYDTVWSQLKLPHSYSFKRGTASRYWLPWLRQNAVSAFPSRAHRSGANFPQLSLIDFCDLHPIGRFVITMPGHFSSVVDGMVHDDHVISNTAKVISAWEVTSVSLRLQT